MLTSELEGEVFGNNSEPEALRPASSLTPNPVSLESIWSAQPSAGWPQAVSFLTFSLWFMPRAPLQNTSPRLPLWHPGLCSGTKQLLMAACLL